jgi:hypothetical protein
VIPGKSERPVCLEVNIYRFDNEQAREDNGAEYLSQGYSTFSTRTVPFKVDPGYGDDRGCI